MTSPVRARATKPREQDLRFAEQADSVLASRRDDLEQSESCLSLTNAEGVILRQWLGSRALAARLEHLDITPGFVVDESIIGTSSGTSLLSRRPTLVRGPEHFAAQFSALTSAGTVITHPVSRRVVGSLNLTCRFADTSRLALAWIRELAADVEAALLHRSSRAERTLIERFMRENRDTGHPVLAVSAETIVTNAAAARLLGGVDQAGIWEQAARVLTADHSTVDALTVTDGRRLRACYLPIHDDDRIVGVIVRLIRTADMGHPTSTPVPAPTLDGLVGHSAAWRSLAREVRAAGSRPMLVVGEPGSGRASIASVDLPSDAPVLDARDAAVAPEAWLARLTGLLRERPSALLMRHLDETPADLTAAVADALSSASGRTILRATATRLPGTSGRDELVAPLGAVIHVPPLAARLEDLPDLLRHLTERHSPPGTPPPRWMPDAVQALSRLDWPANLRSLETLVAQVVAMAHTGYIGARDLPAHVISAASRRTLVGLERAEATTILQALRDHQGNKKHAAAALGIARSTLYRKMRALGIDLDTRAF
ncbi:hypothetical protein ND748_02330 [Frankia sp. AiPs1]|uniref:sigma-54-dependent Fis family transcriptional regulator n=1 Tax=Frankia sp. AiPs1 TaxID=573493 RepID=UPI0020443566|nr:helix-turn-helix domain-containing protein [Frankia sp. AiPs1]MCM3920521.1 hypothetical protein [Frankia sp. AiPs1]